MSYTTIIYNGKLVPSNQSCLNFNDRSFNLGHGIFETILIKKGSIPLRQYHWERLESSAAQVGIAMPFNFQELECMLSELIENNALKNKIAGARVTLSCGYSERGILPAKGTKSNFVITVFEYTPMTNTQYSALIVNARKNEHSLSSRIKSTSYLDNILAKQEAVAQGYDEAILLNTASQVADGAISNIFMVKDGKIFTPPIKDGALPGVVRRVLLEEFSNEFTVVERSISLQDLFDADEVFLTNALMGIRTVTLLNQMSFSDFPLANKIQKWFRQITDYI